MKKESLESFLYRLYATQTATTYIYHITTYLMRNNKAHTYTYNDVVNYINYLKQLNKQDKSISIKLASIKKYYDFLIEQGVREDHPCRNINLKKKKCYVQLQDLFSVEELELLMTRENRYSNLEHRNKVIISLLIYQGLSSSELVRTQLEDINLDEGTIYVRSSKSISSRLLNIKANQIRLIERYITESRPELLGSSRNDSLLISMRGVSETVDGIHSMIEPLKGLFPGRKLSPQTIRQSVISNLLNEYRKPVEDVQLFAGHKYPSSTEKYLRKDTDKEREKVNMWHPLG
jgi:integrase/recombinase XerD